MLLFVGLRRRYATGISDGNSKVNLGESVSGHACSKIFRQCGNDGGQASNVHCRIQSPGFPGVYPRNAHCTYRVSHRSTATTSLPTSGGTPATGQQGRRHAVVLWQNDGRKINLRDWNQAVDQNNPPSHSSSSSSTGQQQQPTYQQQRLRSAAECEAAGDYISIYDGASTSAPLLARFCDGPLPEVVSSGPDVTVEFRSSPVDTVYAAAPAIEGFELKVRIALVTDAASPVATLAAAGSEGAKCQWNVTSSGLSRGLLTAPHQTWPLHTTCHFRFLGRPDERVWIYFAKYHFVGTSPRASSRSSFSQQCRNVLRIAEGDGGEWDPATAVVNGTVIKSPPPARATIGLYCRDRPPPLCERQLPALWAANQSKTDRVAAAANSQPPPCLAGESFVSAGPTLTVQQYLPDGTALSSWKYALAYEFFRVSQDGLPWNWTKGAALNSFSPSSTRSYDCNRLFSVQQQADLRGNVKSPQNVFLFGRGGAKNLR